MIQHLYCATFGKWERLQFCQVWQEIMEIRTTHIEQGSSYLDEHFFRFGQNRLEALPVGEHFPALNFHVEGFFEERPGHCPREDPRHVGMDLRVGLHLRQDRIPRVEQAGSRVLASTREWNKLR